jgi:Conserved nitrate reductase-associated protein (Nitr_red_assoc)
MTIAPRNPPAEDDLELMPRSVRDKLDRVGLKIHLREWQALDLSARRALHDLACETDEEVKRYGAEVDRLVADITGRKAERLRAD